jgi:F-type H+-transporting ATPase subunit a
MISEISRVVSFSFRLFGNVFAGEVLLIIIVFLLPYVAPVPFLMMEIFVGAIQAFIFSMLTLVFLSSNITATEH